MAEPMTLQGWIETKLKPWQAEMAAKKEAMDAQRALLKDRIPQLETLVGLVLDGKTKAAVLAWNTLGIHPQVKDIRLSPDGRVVTLVATDGAHVVLDVAQMEADLEVLRA